MARTVKVLLGNPSYKGPDKHCFGSHYEFLHYLGRLQERSHWIAALASDPVHGPEYAAALASSLPPLDRISTTDLAELRPGDPAFEFAMAEAVGNSIIGQARDDIVQRALQWNADYIFFFDDDMIFARDAFLRLWRHQKPFVGALAFTARPPIAPVLWKFKRSWVPEERVERIDMDCFWDYPQDQLVKVDAIGTGVVLISTDVFKRIPNPWFNGSLAAGEDVHLCVKCGQMGIPVYCDTSVKTMHMPNEPLRWHDERLYLEEKEKSRTFYKARQIA